MCTYAQLTTRVKVPKPAADVPGTTADLLADDQIVLKELMYGMMLPSGNDAATALAIHFGGILKTEGKGKPDVVVSDAEIDRRLLAKKMVIARDYKEKLEKETQAET